MGLCCAIPTTMHYLLPSSQHNLLSYNHGNIHLHANILHPDPTLSPSPPCSITTTQFPIPQPNTYNPFCSKQSTCDPHPHHLWLLPTNSYSNCTLLACSTILSWLDNRLNNIYGIIVVCMGWKSIVCVNCFMANLIGSIWWWKLGKLRQLMMIYALCFSLLATKLAINMEYRLRSISRMCRPAESKYTLT